MASDVIRLNITLPKDIADSLNLMAGPRKRSRFIAEAIAERIGNIRKEQLERDLAEGYSVAREESVSLSTEFETFDLEGWDAF
jgi:metal-responsive CopG/Arc/MetJ family transcriptional regulator